MNPYLAMETALTSRNSSLYSELEDIALWIYYTNKNTIAENNYFDRAADFPVLKYTFDENFSKPSVLISAFMEPLAFYPFKVQFLPESSAMSPDTIIGFLLNKDLANAYTQAMNNKREAEVRITERENSAGCGLSIINNNYCIEKNHPDSELAMILIERLGTNIINDELVFPNPLVLGEDDYLAFPVDYNASIGKKAELTIYSTENYKLFYKTIEVGIKEKHKTITWTDFPDDFSTGVYFYTIVIDDKKTYGKFAVKNRK